MQDAQVNTQEHLLQFDLSRGGKQAAGPLVSLPIVGAAAALSVSIPHALGVGLLAFGPLASFIPASALALWSAALPGALMTLLARSPGVVYAPSTAVALLFGGMLALVIQAGEASGMNAGQALAITGSFAGLGFLLQWVMAQLGLLRLARFIPLSVSQGFAAGVGLSLVVGQLQGMWASSGAHWSTLLAWHMGIAAAVALLSQGLQRLWPKFPALLAAVSLVALACWLLLPEAELTRVASPSGFMLPVFPDWWAAPWWVVIEQYGFQLASLALLMSVVNTLEVTVFHQQMEAEYGVRQPMEKVLGREALIATACALLGMIPASSSTSRSRTALSYTGRATLRPGQWHALGLIAVAGSGHLWLGQVPTAVLTGALLVAGLRMIPAAMLPFNGETQRVATRVQSWLVGLVFVVSSGAMALLAGLAVAMVELLRTSGAHAVRRIHLEGKLRSRHVRRAEVEQWLAPQMRRVAVFELQGIVSFGVAALVVEQVRLHLKDHRCVILDAARVPSWDETGCLRLRALAHELHEQGIAFVICGIQGWVAQAMSGLHTFADLDHALEWAEDQILQNLISPLSAPDLTPAGLGELGVGIDPEARQTLEQRITLRSYGPRDAIIRQGEMDRALLLVPEGEVTLSTGDTPLNGMRLSVIGAGAVFGEMAFLNGMPRTAYAYAGDRGATIGRLGWDDFQAWSAEHPHSALTFITALARASTLRLSATSQQLRAALD